MYWKHKFKIFPTRLIDGSYSAFFSHLLVMRNGDDKDYKGKLHTLWLGNYYKYDSNFYGMDDIMSERETNVASLIVKNKYRVLDKEANQQVLKRTGERTISSSNSLEEVLAFCKAKVKVNGPLYITELTHEIKIELPVVVTELKKTVDNTDKTK